MTSRWLRCWRSLRGKWRDSWRQGWQVTRDSINDSPDDCRTEAYINRWEEVEMEFVELNLWIERERKESDMAGKLRTLDVLVNEILKMQAEFARVLQETAAMTLARAPSEPSDAGAGQPSVAEMMEAVNNLDARFDWYDSEITAKLLVLLPISTEVGQDHRHDDLRKKWASLSFLKKNAGEDLRRRVNLKKQQMAASKASSIPRISPMVTTGSTTAMTRSASASPTMQSPNGRQSPPSVGTRSYLRTPSPMGFAKDLGRTSVSPLGHRSLSNGPGRLSPHASAKHIITCP
ncbi:hypothetical protein BC829DRAFT_255883 [Chytridium lagenaria]|nr:hypothetical protein BC829DRAFT_255883 [Chytridium lagenaria]